MQIVVTGRHGVDPEMRAYAERKLARLPLVYDRLTSAEVVLESDGAVRRAEAVVSAPRGTRLVARAEADDLRAALDALERRLLAQARKLKDRLADRRRASPDRGAA